MILLQTLVMAVILSMIAVMVMQWVLGRYMTAARTYRSSASKVHSQGYSFDRLSTWNFQLMNTVPSIGHTVMDGQTVFYVAYSVPSSGMRTVDMTSDEDTYAPS